MASIVKQENNNKKYPKDPLDKNLLLGSIKDFQPTGVKLGVEKMGRAYNKGHGVYAAIQLCVMDEMDKLRKYVLDDEEQYIVEKDELTGETKQKIEITPANLDLATIHLKLGSQDKSPDDDTECKFTKFSSSYSLFVSALIANGDLPDEAYGETIATTVEELREALEGFTFIATVKGNSYKGKKYEYLYVKEIL